MELEKEQLEEGKNIELVDKIDDNLIEKKAKAANIHIFSADGKYPYFFCRGVYFFCDMISAIKY